jgi:hypothetical protein
MQLRPYERHMACLLSGVLIGLSAVVLSDRRPMGADQGDEISLHVVGAVDEAYVHMRAGATLEDLLQTIHLHPDADTSELDGASRLVGRSTIVIPFADCITVYVTGAVEEEKVVMLPKDAEPKCILDRVTTLENADRASFLRRKRIKNGEIIKIKAKSRAKRLLQN